MKQSATQVPLLHTSPEAHEVPFGCVRPRGRGACGRADLAGVARVHRAGRVERAADEAIGDAGCRCCTPRRKRTRCHPARSTTPSWSLWACRPGRRCPGSPCRRRRACRRCSSRSRSRRRRRRPRPFRTRCRLQGWCTSRWRWRRARRCTRHSYWSLLRTPRCSSSR